MSSELPLGRNTPVPREYAPDVLVGVPRAEGRGRLGLGDELPFDGVDVWNAYELGWLDPRGKPVVATGELRVLATSPNLVESKSLKLYLNSLNGMRHESVDEVGALIVRDVGAAAGADVTLRLTLAREAGAETLSLAEGACIDDADVDIDAYGVRDGLLRGAADADDPVEETLVSHLLRSNCPVTGQPDWGSVTLRYHGGRIDRAALLRYLVSFREHDEFHEQCVERIFVDVKRHCAPRALSVVARYTRRGGLDINPFRSDFETLGRLARVWRQ